MPMYKQVVSLTYPQFDYLSREAARLDVSVAEVVRRIIDAYREGREQTRENPC